MGRWYGVALAQLGLAADADGERLRVSGRNPESEAVAALEEALVRTELHEDMEGALQGLALLERVQLDLPGLAAVRARIMERKALLDRLAEEECRRMNL